MHEHARILKKLTPHSYRAAQNWSRTDVLHREHTLPEPPRVTALAHRPSTTAGEPEEPREQWDIVGSKGGKGEQERKEGGTGEDGWKGGNQERHGSIQLPACGNRGKNIQGHHHFPDPSLPSDARHVAQACRIRGLPPQTQKQTDTTGIDRR